METNKTKLSSSVIKDIILANVEDYRKDSVSNLIDEYKKTVINESKTRG